MHFFKQVTKPRLFTSVNLKFNFAAEDNQECMYLFTNWRPVHLYNTVIALASAEASLLGYQYHPQAAL